MEILDTLLNVKHAGMYGTLTFLLLLAGTVVLYAKYGPEEKKKKVKKPVVLQKENKVLERTEPATAEVAA